MRGLSSGTVGGPAVLRLGHRSIMGIEDRYVMAIEARVADEVMNLMRG